MRTRSIGMISDGSIDAPIQESEIILPPDLSVIAVIAGQDVDNTTRAAYILSDQTADRCNDPDFASNFGYAVAKAPDDFGGSYPWCIAADSDMLQSLDGIDLNSAVSNLSSALDIVWCNSLGLFVSGGIGPLGADPDNRIIQTSVFGGTWLTRHTAWEVEGGVVNGLAWSEEQGKILAFGSDGLGSQTLMSSTDGITWFTESDLAFGNELYRGCYSPELDLWIAVGPAGDGNGIYSSPDGTTWTPRQTGGVFTDVAWSPSMSKFLAISDSGARYSSDGITWTLASNTDSANVSGVCWCPTFDQFIVHVGSSARMLTNIDDWFDSANSQVQLGTPTGHGVSGGRCFAI